MPVLQQTVGHGLSVPWGEFAAAAPELAELGYGDVALPESRSWRVTDSSPCPDASLASTTPENHLSDERV
jgi:hypothetical protein